jgi:hypothetical protein
MVSIYTRRGSVNNGDLLENWFHFSSSIFSIECKSKVPAQAAMLVFHISQGVVRTVLCVIQEKK